MPASLATDGLRRSASTMATRLPASASEAARLSDIVDLPSPGIDEVTSRTRRFIPPASMNWRLLLIPRIDSAKVFDPAIISSGRRLCRRRSLETMPMSGAATRREMSSRLRTRVSSALSRKASPTPSTRPAAEPTVRNIHVTGHEGSSEGVAYLTTVTLTSGSEPATGASIFPMITSDSSSATALTMSAAPTAVAAVASISMMS